jgi:3-dehydroquinate synthase
MRQLRAHTPSRQYDVLVGSGVIAELGGAWWLRAPGGRIVVVTDENVAPLYLDPVHASLRDAGFSVSQVVIPAGEGQKSLARAEELYGVLYDRHLARSDALVALGGGVIGDLVGFVAATYQRGMGIVQVPTTLLAQVDAALGGKVGVDFREGKNYVGSFYQPGLVLADLDTLATLPERELRGGMTEVAKYGLLMGGELLALVHACAGKRARVTMEIVAGCAQYKLDVVAADEREESGARAVLNLGHTIGHAVEAAGGFSLFTHGEAVALGLRATLWLSRRLSGLPAGDEQRGQELLSALGLPERADGVQAAEVLDLVRRDKKRRGDDVGYVLLQSLGKPKVSVVVPPDLEREVVEWLLSR